MSENGGRLREGENTTTEEEDLVTRITKKVKTKDGEDVADMVSMGRETQPITENVESQNEPREAENMMQDHMEVQQEAKLSYRDKLLNIDPAEEEHLIIKAMKDMTGMD